MAIHINAKKSSACGTIMDSAGQVSLGGCTVETCKWLRNHASPLMQSFLSDLDHDENWIRRNPRKAFVHVTRRSGTHIVGMPEVERLLEDTPEPFLFGTAKPSEIYRQSERLLRSLKREAVAWAYFDGRRIKRSSADACIEMYMRTRQSAIQRARRQKKRLMLP